MKTKAWIGLFWLLSFGALTENAPPFALPVCDHWLSDDRKYLTIVWCGVPNGALVWMQWTDKVEWLLQPSNVNRLKLEGTLDEPRLFDKGMMFFDADTLTATLVIEISPRENAFFRALVYP